MAKNKWKWLHNDTSPRKYLFKLLISRPNEQIILASQVVLGSLLDKDLTSTLFALMRLLIRIVKEYRIAES